MSKEEKLKEYILNRYHSIREFTLAIDMPYSTVSSVLKRGIDNSSVSNVMRICKALGISADGLADGEIIPVVNRDHNERAVNEYIEIKDILDDTKDLLTHYGFITLDGKPMSKDGVDSIIDAMDVGVELAKRKKR